MCGGAGAGLVIVTLLAPDRPEAPGLLALGLALVALGLFAVWLELGRPLRAANVLLHLKGSWMSRKALAALLLFPLAPTVLLGVRWAIAPAASWPRPSSTQVRILGGGDPACANRPRPSADGAEDPDSSRASACSAGGRVDAAIAGTRRRAGDPADRALAAVAGLARAAAGHGRSRARAALWSRRDACSSGWGPWCPSCRCSRAASTALPPSAGAVLLALAGALAAFTGQQVRPDHACRVPPRRHRAAAHAGARRARTA